MQHKTRPSRLIAGKLLAALLFLAPFLARAAEGLSFLRTRGQDIVNEGGDKIMLRGVGLGNWLLPEGYMWKFGEKGDRPRRIEKIVSDLIGTEKAAQFWAEYRRNYITEADVERMAQLGYNSMRPALNARLFLGADGAPDLGAEGFQLLDHLVAWGKAHGVYVIIDMHAAPGGQTGQNIDDSAEDKPLLFMETKYQDELVALWTALARRYREEAAVAGYDLLNEPLPERTGAAKAYKAHLEPLYQRVTAAIRAVDARHMVIVEGADWANDWSVFSHPFDSNMVYQFHYYCWDAPSTVKSARRYIEAGARFNAPVWVGETGEKDSAIYWATTQYFEANNIGWSFWPWKKMDTRNTPYSVKPPQDWEAVAAYSRDGAKPAPEVAQRAFDALLHNVRLENCGFFPEVVNAMMRQAPVRIEAENYAQDGLNHAYFVHETNRLSRYYRTSEPVKVRAKETGWRASTQFIELEADEWTSYAVSSDAARLYRLTVRARADAAPGALEISVGDQVRTAALTGTNWSAIALDPVTLVAGTNRVKCKATGAAADVDWIELDRLEKPSAGVDELVPNVKK